MRKLGVIAITLMGIAIMAQAFMFMITTTQFLFSPMEYFDVGSLLSLAVYVLGVGAVVAFGALLVGKRDALASRWFDDSESPIALDAPAILRVGLIILGIILVLGSIPHFFSAANLLFGYLTQDLHAEWAVDYTVADLFRIVTIALGAAIELTVGIVFVFRSESVTARLWDGPPA